MCDCEERFRVAEGRDLTILSVVLKTRKVCSVWRDGRCVRAGMRDCVAMRASDAPEGICGLRNRDRDSSAGPSPRKFRRELAYAGL